MWNVLLSYNVSVGLGQLPVVQFVEQACVDRRKLSHGYINLLKPFPVSIK